MIDAVLFVDDEEYVLNSVSRLFTDDGTHILKAANAETALKLIRENEIAVIVSDNLMPGMKGLDLLSRIKEISPDTLRILMTAHADLSTAISAINTSEVFRFIEKPWDDGRLMQTVRDALNRYHIIQSLKKADESALLSLARTLELKDPYTHGHCERVAGYALMIAEALNLNNETKKDIKYGSLLHDCGKIGVPEELLGGKYGRLEEKDMEIIRNHPVWGADIAKQARLSKSIVNIILYHHERFNGKGYPSGISGKDIPLEAMIVAVADVFDAITEDRPYRKAYEIDDAVDLLLSLKGDNLDPEMVDLFLACFGDIYYERQISGKEKSE